MYKEKLATYTEKLAAYIEAGGALKKNAKKKGKKKKKIDEEERAQEVEANDADGLARKKEKNAPPNSDLEVEAKQFGFLEKLRNMEDNPKVTRRPAEILAALKCHHGSVVAVRHYFLGLGGA